MHEINSAEELEAQVGINKPGWYCLRHATEGWLVGNEFGVLCYATEQLARVVRSVATEMDRAASSYIIQPFEENDYTYTGDHETEITSVEAINNLETGNSKPQNAYNPRKRRRGSDT